MALTSAAQKSESFMIDGIFPFVLSLTHEFISNTGILSIDESVIILETLTKSLITPEKEKAGEKKIQDMLVCQKLVNSLIFEHNLMINFLHAQMKGDVIVLQGVADSTVLAEKAVAIASTIIVDKKIESCISVVQDFKAYP